MDLFDPPKFSRQVACVADDPRLAAVVSSLIGDQGEYVGVLPEPRMERPDKNSEVARRCNAVVKAGRVGTAHRSFPWAGQV